MRQVTEFMPDIDLNDVIKALGNPVRRKILYMLKEPKIHFHQPYADADEVRCVCQYHSGKGRALTVYRFSLPLSSSTGTTCYFSAHRSLDVLQT